MKFWGANRARQFATETADEPTWSHPQVLTILAVVFVLGTAVGVTATHAWMHAHMMHRPAPLAVKLKELKSQLNLTAQQESVVTKELDDYAKYYQNIEEERTDVAQHGKQRILRVLTPQQQKRFIDLFEQLPQ